MAHERRSGRLVLWDEDRGFGFIEETGTRDRVWVHVRDFVQGNPRPVLGDEVTYRPVSGREGKPAAAWAEIVGRRPAARAAGRPVARPPRESDSPAMHRVLRVAGALLLAALIGSGVMLGDLPYGVVILYAGAGVVSFSLYWADKRAAIAGQWRVAEATLHGADIFGGIIGGLLAQAVLRHKTSKISFGAMTTLILAGHNAVLLAWMLGLLPL